MQTGCRFVEKVQNALAARPTGKFRSKLHPLRFSARKRRRRLPKAQVSKSHVQKDLKFFYNLRNVLKKFTGFINAHIQNVCNVLAFEFHRQGFLIVTLALTDITGFPHIRKEVHFDRNHTTAFAGFATSTAIRRIVAETVRAKAFHLRKFHLCEKIANRIQDSGKACRRRTRRSRNRALVHGENFLERIREDRL